LKLTYAKYAASKKAGCLGAWWLLTGPEHHLKREVLAQLRAEAEAEGRGGDSSPEVPRPPAGMAVCGADLATSAKGELIWELLDGPSTQARELLSRGQTAGLFGGARAIVVTSAERMETDEQRALAKGLGPLPAEVCVILVTAESAERGRRRAMRAELERAIDAYGTIVEFPALTADRAAEWAIGHAKSLGKKLEVAAARKLAQQKVGTSLDELALEIEKLAAFVGDGKVITSAHVEEVTPRLIEDDIFRLVDAMATQNTGRAVSVLRALLGDRREDPVRIVPMLAQAIREIWQTKLLLERGWRPGREVDEETAELLPQDGRKNVIARFARMPWLVERRLSQARAFSWARLARAMQALHGCDLVVKGIAGQSAEPQVAVELAVVQLCTDLPMPALRG
jgi:DNA polymerase III delta subunit